MQFRSQDRADLTIRVLLLAGIACGIAGGLIVPDHAAVGSVLLTAGVLLAAGAPIVISGPDPSGAGSSDRESERRSGGS